MKGCLLLQLNVASRTWAVHVPKVKRKSSDRFRTLDGAEHFCVIGSFRDTPHKQGHNMLTVLLHAFAGTPVQSAA